MVDMILANMTFFLIYSFFWKFFLLSAATDPTPDMVTSHNHVVSLNHQIHLHRCAALNHNLKEL